MSTKIEIKPKNNRKAFKSVESVQVSEGATAGELIGSIAKQSGLSVHRLRVTIANPNFQEGVKGSKKEVVLTEDALLKGIDEVKVKDLGPQLGWRMVYFVEYLGPILIHPLFYFGQSLFYGQRFEHSRVQQLAFMLSMLHFVKREYETLFVHKFSLATMPAFNIFKNSGHYWILSGLFLAYFIYAPHSYVDEDASALSKFFFGRHYYILSANQLHVLTAAWLFAELSNFWVHLTLANLRKPGDKRHVIPYGYGFQLVSFPNYFFESLSWWIFFLITQNWSALFFFIVGSGQMLVWAIKKHQRYRKEFGDKYPRDRKAMIPFLI